MVGYLATSRMPIERMHSSRPSTPVLTEPRSTEMVTEKSGNCSLVRT